MQIDTEEQFLSKLQLVYPQLKYSFSNIKEQHPFTHKLDNVYELPLAYEYKPVIMLPVPDSDLRNQGIVIVYSHFLAYLVNSDDKKERIAFKSYTKAYKYLLKLNVD